MPKDDDMGKKIVNLSRLEKILKNIGGKTKRYDKNNTNLLSYWRKSNFDLPANFIPWLKKDIDRQEDIALQTIGDFHIIFMALGTEAVFYKNYNQRNFNIPNDILPYFLYFRAENECIKSYLEFLFNTIHIKSFHGIENKQKDIIQKVIYRLAIYGSLFGFSNKEKVMILRISDTLNINIDQSNILPDPIVNSLDEKIWFEEIAKSIILGKIIIKSLKDIDKELIGGKDIIGFSKFPFPKQDKKDKGVQTMMLGNGAKSIYITGLKFLYASIEYSKVVDYDYHKEKKGGCIVLYHNIKHIRFEHCLTKADKFFKNLGIDTKRPKLNDKYVTYGGYILKYYFKDEITLVNDKIQKFGVGNKKIKGDYKEYTDKDFKEWIKNENKSSIYIDISTGT